MNTSTRSELIAADVAALLRARNPLLWIVTREEARVERYLLEAAAEASYGCRTWDVAQGVCDMTGNVEDSIGGRDPGETLAAIKSRAENLDLQDRCVWIMRDLPAWLSGPPNAPTLRQLRNLARMLPSIETSCAQAIVILTPTADVPAELAGHTTMIEWPLPDRAEISEILDSAIEALPADLQAGAMDGTRDAAIDAAVGLSQEEAQACYSKSLVQLRRIDPATVTAEKKRLVSRDKVLEWIDPLPGGLDAIGGLENAKSWLVTRRSAYSAEAREYGLPAPKGIFLVGVPGCAKSMLAKAVPTAWEIPCLRLDLGAAKSKFVGESETNLRNAFATISAIGRCVVWIDEIEKAMQGATSGSSDGGVSSDALGAFLNWMQERQGEAFVIATANDVESLPPELLRKGRFDEVWWVDVPTPAERSAVLQATLRTNGRGKAKIDLAKVAAECDGYTGAEIAALVPEALFTAFNDGAREITTADLIAAAQTVVPLTKTAAEKIARLRTWAAGRARPASAAPETKQRREATTARRIDL